MRNISKLSKNFRVGSKIPNLNSFLKNSEKYFSKSVDFDFSPIHGFRIFFIEFFVFTFNTVQKYQKINLFEKFAKFWPDWKL